MSLTTDRVTRQTALETARALIGTTYASTQDAETSFNGWTLIARCFGGKALTFAPGWGPRERSIALNTFLGRGMAPITLAQAKPGDVLAFVSKPTFDPNLFVDGIDQENWQALNESLDKSSRAQSVGSWMS
jgi:hypothetical protein